MQVFYPTIDDKKFHELIAEKNSIPFLVVFTADWLGEGIIMDDIIKLLAGEYQGRFNFFRMDIDASKGLAQQLNIGRLPAIFFFQNGEFINRVQGLRPKHVLQEEIERMV